MTKTQRLEARIKRAAEHAKEMAATFRHTAEAAAASGILAYVHGRELAGEDFKIMGLPVDLTAALAFGGLGLFEVGGAGYSDDLVAFGTGALCHYTARVGYEMGADAKAASSRQAGGTVHQLHGQRTQFGGQSRNPYRAAA